MSRRGLALGVAVGAALMVSCAGEGSSSDTTPATAVSDAADPTIAEPFTTAATQAVSLAPSTTSTTTTSTTTTSTTTTPHDRTTTVDHHDVDHHDHAPAITSGDAHRARGVDTPDRVDGWLADLGPSARGDRRRG